MNSKIVLRPASVADAQALVDIYAPYVIGTAITFEYDVPSVDEFAQRISTISAKFPYIVASIDGEPVGYAYANTFKGRRAYDWCVETSIYVHKDHRKEGVGKVMLEALEAILARLGYLNVYACIATPVVPDEYQDRNSVEFHGHMGYRMVGEFVKCGYKFGRWYNMVWMEKFVGNHDAPVSQVADWDGNI